MSERGPLYGMPLIDSLPLSGGPMIQQLPSADDLRGVMNYRQGHRVVAGFEVLTGTYLQLKNKVSGDVCRTLLNVISVIANSQDIRDTLWIPGEAQETVVDRLCILAGELGVDNDDIEAAVRGATFGAST